MGGGIVWFKLDRMPMLARRAVQIDVVSEKNFSKGGVRFGEIRIEAERLKGSFFRERRRVSVIRLGVTWEDDIGAGQASVSQSVVRIVCDSLLKQGDSFRDIVSGTLLPERPALLI